MSGGIMFDYVTPEDCITFSVIKKIENRACIDQMKLEDGMIVITDDKKRYNFLCSDSVELFDISLNPKINPLLTSRLRDVVDLYYYDRDQTLATLLARIIENYAEVPNIDTQNSMKIEEEISQAMLQVLESQKAQIPHFTKSEKIAMEIKRRLFKHMDGNLTINTLAQEYDISTKSLQNAFRSLFDLTPNQFMRLLKLNLAHHELIHSHASQISVMQVAKKWGFRHMGRFSKYYSDLFGEKPSVTLKSDLPQVDGMQTHCVERQEEIL
jgi:AraC-like DNA-binding protein